MPWYEACQRDARQGQCLLLEALPRHLQDFHHQLHRHFNCVSPRRLTISPGLLVIPNVSNSVSEKIICKKDSDFALFRLILHHLRITHFITCRRHMESSKHFSDWCGKHLTTKKPLDHEMFVSVVTRLNGLYVLVETPQQNIDSGVDGGGEEVSKNYTLYNL